MKNRPKPKRKLIFQPSSFRCELLVSGRVLLWVFLHIPGGWEWGFLNHQQYHVIQSYINSIPGGCLPHPPQNFVCKSQEGTRPFQRDRDGNRTHPLSEPFFVFVVRFILEPSNVRSTTIGLTVTGQTLESFVAERCMGGYAFQQHGII